MKLTIALGLALSAGLAHQSLAHEPPLPGGDSPSPRLARQVNDLQSAIVEGMRASESADKERPMARLSADINAFQENVLRSIR